MEKYTLLHGADGAIVERGLLPMRNYIEMGGRGSLLLLRVEPTQLLCVPWVIDVLPCLGVAQSIRAS
jgi:hypothetical protein